MAATAAARRASGATRTARRVSRENATRAAARGAPARGSARRAGRAASRAPRRRQVTPIPGRVVVAGVGRTAGAVGGLADSGLVVRLTRGRLWIGLLATLLVGIVALNVIALGFNASSSKVAQANDQLRRANLALEARIAGELSSQEVQAAAAKLGLVLPGAAGIRYLKPEEGDAAAAAKRLASGELTAALAPVAPVAPAPTAVPTDPAVTGFAP
jgi:hypothetical protein